MERYFLIALLFFLEPASALWGAPGDVDPSFDTGGSGGGFAPGLVRAVVPQPDGKVIVGGSVNEIGGTEVNGIARLNADGTIDSTFIAATGFGGSVVSIVLQPDGKVMVGGRFSTINETTRHGVARLNADGSVDDTFDPGTGGKRGFSAGRIWCVAVQSDGKVLVGGEFTSFDDTARNLVARLNKDGSLDSGFDPVTGEDETVQSIAVQEDGKVLVGGGFTIGDGTDAIGIARLNADGSLDTTFNAGIKAGAMVNSIALQTDGKVLVGGYEAGMMQGLIARLNMDGTLDSTFIPGTETGYLANSLALQTDGKVLVAGYEAGTTKGLIVRLNSDGSLDSTFSVEADDLIWSVVVEPDGNVLAGGDFGAINGASQVYVARLFGGPLAVAPISLTIQKASNQVLLSWTNEAFSLQSAPFVTGPYTDVPGATSPYTNAITGTQQYFLLRAE